MNDICIGTGYLTGSRSNIL